MLPPIAKLSDLSEGAAQPGYTTKVVETKPSSHRLIGFELVVKDKAKLPSSRQCVLIKQGPRSPVQFPLKELVLVS